MAKAKDRRMSGRLQERERAHENASTRQITCVHLSPPTRVLATTAQVSSPPHASFPPPLSFSYTVHLAVKFHAQTV